MNKTEIEIEEQLPNFDKLNLKDTLLRGIYSYGFEAPSRIQGKAIPFILAGRDVIAQSQSGTGKTGAFSISALHLVDESVNGCQVIIIAHTRELAQQIHDVTTNLGTYTTCNVVLCVGGQEIKKTKEQIEN